MVVRRLLLALALLCPVSAWAAPTLDAHTFSNDVGSPDPTHDYTHAVGSCANRVLYVAAWGGNELIIGAGVTARIDGVTMPVFHEETTFTRHFKMWRVIGPATGARTISITADPAGYETSSHAVSFCGVDQGDPDGAVQRDQVEGGFGSSVSVPSAVGDLVVDLTITNGSMTGLTQDASQTLIDIDGTSEMGSYKCGMSYQAGAAGSVSMDWTWSGGHIARTAIGWNLNAADGDSPPPSAPTNLRITPGDP